MRTLFFVCFLLAAGGAAAADVTRHRIHTFTPDAGLVMPPAYDAPPGSAGTFNIVRHATIGSQPVMALINGHTGHVRIQAIDGSGVPAAVLDDQTLPKLRCTDARLLSYTLGAKLVALDTFHGTLVIYTLTGTGQIDLTSERISRSKDLKDKNVFDAFLLGGAWRLFGLDTFSGNVAVFDPEGALVAREQWSTGYTSVDHVTDGAKTFRVLYKAAGDPNTLAGELDDKAGLLVVQLVSANGMKESNTQDVLTTAGWSAVRFVTFPGPGGTFTYRALFHDRERQRYMHVVFDAATGKVVWPSPLPVQSNSGGAWSEVEPFVSSGVARVSVLDGDGVEPFSYDEVERMARAVHNRLRSRVAGYQLAVAQSGRVVYLRAWGNTKASAPQQAMTSRTRMDVGSVSKLVTTVNVAKLSTQGLVDLYAPLSNVLPGTTPAGWVQEMSVWNALTHTTGMSDGGCVGDPDTLRADCTAFYERGREVTPADPGTPAVTDDYPRTYNNSGIMVMRDVYSYLQNVSASSQIPAFTQQLWQHPVGDDMSELTCRHDPDVFYFGPCRGAVGCVSAPGGDRFQEAKIIEDWSTNCSAGGWASSSRRLLELMDELRYGRILGSTPEQALLFDATLTSGGKPTAFAWDVPTTINGEPVFVKGGYNDDDVESTVAFRAAVYHFDGNVDAVLLVNTQIPDVKELLKDTYQFGRDSTFDIDRFVEEDVMRFPGTFTKVAVQETSEHGEYGSFNYVLAGLRPDGFLQLHAVDVSTALQATLTDEVVDAPATGFAMTDGDVFALAIRDANNDLQVTFWNHSIGTLYASGTWIGGTAKDVDIARAGRIGVNTTRAAVLIRTTDGDLRLRVLDHDLPSGIVTPFSDVAVGRGSAGVIQTLVPGNLLNAVSRVVVAFRNSSGALETQVWEINAAGVAKKMGSHSMSTVSSSSGRQIAIDQRGDGSAFFSGNGFLTTSVTGAGKLEVRRYSVDAGGAPHFETVSSPNLAVSTVDTLALRSTVLTASGKLELQRWQVDGTGKVSLVHATTLGNGNEIVTAGGKVAWLRNSSNQPKLVLFSEVP